MTRQLRIAVGLPHYQGRSEFHHTRMWLQFGHVLAYSEERFMLVAFALIDVCGIDRARNACVETAREADADWLLMIDGDTWVDDGGDLLQMISDADKVGATIVGAAVPRRRVDGDPRVNSQTGTLMVYHSPKIGEFVSLTEAAIRGRVFETVPSAERGVTYDHFCPVDAMATACMAINMRHVEFMDQPFFRFTDVESEDLDFCRRVREMRGGWQLVDEVGRPHPNGRQTTWEGHILVDKRVKAFHLNRPATLEGL